MENTTKILLLAIALLTVGTVLTNGPSNNVTEAYKLYTKAKDSGAQEIMVPTRAISSDDGKEEIKVLFKLSPQDMDMKMSEEHMLSKGAVPYLERILIRNKWGQEQRKEKHRIAALIFTKPEDPKP